MKHFLLVFDRSQARLLGLDEYSNREAALAARFDAEKRHAESVDIEVVVLSAASRDELKRTHSRYFTEFGSLYRGSLDRLARRSGSATAP